MEVVNSPPPLRLRRARNKWTCELEYRDKKGLKCLGKGRVFLLDHGQGNVQELEAFPIGVLCGILGRSYRCVYKWEKDYAFPKALYNFEDDGQKKRWYSRAQLLMIQSLYQTFHRLEGAHKTRLKEFIKLVDAVWISLDARAVPKEKDGSNV